MSAGCLFFGLSYKLWVVQRVMGVMCGGERSQAV